MIVELEYQQLRQRGSAIFDILRSGGILVVRRVPLILEVRRQILAIIASSCSAERQRRIEHFFDALAYPGDDEFVVLLDALKLVRDSRYVSCLFSELIGGMGFPQPALVDTGHFRFILPFDFPRLFSRMERGELLARNDFPPIHPSEPEPSVDGRTVRPKPHRDLDRPHYTFQANFWFPMHDIGEREGLLLFPEAYYEDVPYYQQPDNLMAPETWGYGRPFQPVMAFSDMLLFHSQHFHASPSTAPDRNRLSAELRVAAGAVDDNSSYRRLFWNVANFDPIAPALDPQGRPQTRGDAAMARMAARLISRGNGADTLPADLLVDGCFHDAFQTLFATPYDARLAGDVSKSDDASQAARTPAPVFASTVRLLGRGRFAEDRLVALLRLAANRGDTSSARDLAARLVDHSSSYFWLLETARQCGARGWLDLARRAAERAAEAATHSDARLDRYGTGLPIRSAGPIQLLPRHALRAGRAILRQCQRLQEAKHTGPAMLDYRLFYPDPTIVVSFERYDVLNLRSHGVHAALAVTRPFHPESLLENPDDIVIAHTEDDVEAAIRDRAGRRLESPRSHAVRLVDSYRGYNVLSWLNGLYVIPQSAGTISLNEENVLEHEGCLLVEDETAARAAIEAAAGVEPPPTGAAPEAVSDTATATSGPAADMLRGHVRLAGGPVQLVVSGFAGTQYNVLKYGGAYYAVHQREGSVDAIRLQRGPFTLPVTTARTWEDLVHEMSKLGPLPDAIPEELTLPESGPPPIATDNFLNLAFAGNRDAFTRALLASLRGARRVILIGRPDAVAPYVRQLEDAGLEASVADLSRNATLPTPSPGVRILYCEVPVDLAGWELFRTWSARIGSSLETVWGATLPFAGIVALQEKFEFNSPTFAGMAEFYEGARFCRPALAPLSRMVDFHDKSVIEIGPSDGVYTGALVQLGARQITAIEARPENIVKLLAAKFAFGWSQLEIVAENFHAITPDRYGRYDIAFAEGVYYHSNSPLLFLHQLSRLSDVIVIGGWCATDERPPSAWETWNYEGTAYRGKTYVEPTHFLSGMQSESVYLDYAGLRQFFVDRGYDCEEIAIENVEDVTGLFVHFVARRRAHP
jgi:hypothetical protein